MLTAITGGIGSGKSVVCHILKAIGYPVYDCDSRAKTLMDSDEDIKRRLAEEIHDSVILMNGSIDRPRLSQLVFADAGKLLILNRIVHAAVREDIKLWYNMLAEEAKLKGFSQPIAFVETAILYESEVDKMVDSVWEVTAPIETRIERVAKRNGLTRGQIEARIESQSSLSRPSHRLIVNDGITPVLPQIESLLVF